jgi:hypothetical protein
MPVKICCDLSIMAASGRSAVPSSRNAVFSKHPTAFSPVLTYVIDKTVIELHASPEPPSSEVVLD